MAARDSQQRRAGERRRLFDRRSPFPRRSGTDRRRGERRAANLRVARERRSGMDRRHEERRGSAERRLAATRRVGRRRRETPTPYTVEELARVRDALTSRRGPVACPACNGAFTLGRPRRRGKEVVRQVQCLSRGRNAVVSNTWMARVLVIDEKEVVRDTLRLILSSAGHEVTEAADAGVGLRAYQLVPPDVVFIDVLSSGRMDAAEFIRRLRAEHPDARVSPCPAGPRTARWIRWRSPPVWARSGRFACRSRGKTSWPRSRRPAASAPPPRTRGVRGAVRPVPSLHAVIAVRTTRTGIRVTPVVEPLLDAARRLQP